MTLTKLYIVMVKIQAGFDDYMWHEYSGNFHLDSESAYREFCNAQLDMMEDPTILDVNIEEVYR